MRHGHMQKSTSSFLMCPISQSIVDLSMVFLIQNSFQVLVPHHTSCCLFFGGNMLSAIQAAHGLTLQSQSIRPKQLLAYYLYWAMLAPFIILTTQLPGSEVF